MEMPTIGFQHESAEKTAKPSKASIKRAMQVVVTLAVLTASSPGFCQLANMTGKITGLVTWLASLSIAIFTGVFLYVGYKIIFAGSQFRDMVNILIGGFFVGGAAGLAAFVAA